MVWVRGWLRINASESPHKIRSTKMSACKRWRVCGRVCVKQEVTNMHGYRYRYFICFLLQSNKRRLSKFLFTGQKSCFYLFDYFIFIIIFFHFELRHLTSQLWCLLLCAFGCCLCDKLTCVSWFWSRLMSSVPGQHDSAPLNQLTSVAPTLESETLSFILFTNAVEQQPENR